MANRAIDFLITYRIVKLLSTDFKDQEAFKFGIIDANGKVLRPSRTLNTQAELDSYTVLHRFIFNLKRFYWKKDFSMRCSAFSTEKMQCFDKLLL